jgi:large subunit ribosomal protein L30
MIGRPEKHRAVLRGMGLTKMQQVVQLPDTPHMRGMVNKVRHLVCIEAEAPLASLEDKS